MVKRDPLDQAQKLDEKIKEMKEKQQRYIEKAEREIGNYVMKQWDVEDIEQAKKVIDYLKTDAKAYFQTVSEEKETNRKDGGSSWIKNDQ